MRRTRTSRRAALASKTSLPRASARKRCSHATDRYERSWSLGILASVLNSKASKCMPLPFTEPTIDLGDAHVTFSPTRSCRVMRQFLGIGKGEEKAGEPFKRTRCSETRVWIQEPGRWGSRRNKKAKFALAWRRQR